MIDFYVAYNNGYTLRNDENRVEIKRNLRKRRKNITLINLRLLPLITEEQQVLSQIKKWKAKIKIKIKRKIKVPLLFIVSRCIVQDINDRFKEEEDARNNLFQNKKKLEQEVAGLKKDIEDLELNLQKSEQDKATKDHQIRNLNDEIAHQDELINKLNKEKKNQGEVNQKTAEELQAAEDKVNHLNKVKIKLEQTLDELEDSLEREKKSRLVKRFLFFFFFSFNRKRSGGC